MPNFSKIGARLVPPVAHFPISASVSNIVCHPLRPNSYKRQHLGHHKFRQWFVPSSAPHCYLNSNDLLLIGPSDTNVDEIAMGIQKCSFYFLEKSRFVHAQICSHVESQVRDVMFVSGDISVSVCNHPIETIMGFILGPFH